ncbi:MAG: hypothetical protein IJL97_00910, partial [Lachnospiraceae bacterium]|nr:hypothetical protein [Lachnospiraceae bacterium]
MHVRLEIMQCMGNASIKQFIESCMFNGFQVFRIDNGTPDMQEVWFKNIYPDYKLETLPEEKNRGLRHFLYRAKQYGMQYGNLPEDLKKEGTGRALLEFALTMRFNAYREFYRGICYALIGAKEGGIEYYSMDALDRAKAVMAEDEFKKKGYDFSTLIHGMNRGGEIVTGAPGMFFVNQTNEAGLKERGLVCAFTDYKAAEKGLEMFEKANLPCSILAATGKEILAQAAQTMGIVIDMGDIDFVVFKSDFASVVNYGNLDAPILVTLKKEDKDGQKEDKGE